jgi:hypothetical protein
VGNAEHNGGEQGKYGRCAEMIEGDRHCFFPIAM